MSTGFLGAHPSWLSPCETILVTPRLQGILQYKKSTEKHATHQKVKPKSKKVKFAPHSQKVSTVQLEQRCFRCFRCIAFGNYAEGRIRETGAALCIHKLVLSHSTFLCVQNWGGPNSITEIPPQRTEAAVKVINTATQLGQRRRPRESTSKLLNNFTFK